MRLASGSFDLPSLIYSPLPFLYDYVYAHWFSLERQARSLSPGSG